MFYVLRFTFYVWLTKLFVDQKYQNKFQLGQTQVWSIEPSIDQSPARQYIWFNVKLNKLGESLICLLYSTVVKNWRPESTKI